MPLIPDSIVSHRNVRFLITAMPYMPWKKFAILLFAANCVLVYQICILITNECERVFPIHISLPNVMQKPVSILDKVTVVMVEFEPDSSTLRGTLASYCQHYSAVKFLLVYESTPYPPLDLTQFKECRIETIVTRDDIRKRWEESDPMHYITTDYVLVVPDGAVFDQSIPLDHLKYNRIYKKDVHLIPIAKDPSFYTFRCINLYYDYRLWFLKYSQKTSDSSEGCHSHDGDFAFLLTKSSLKLLSMPFARPFPESIFIQGLFKGFSVTLEDDLRFPFSPKQSDREIRKLEGLKDWRLAQLYHRLGIKKVENIDGTIEMHGCSKNTQRCFRSIHNNTPEYLLEDRWTPPCCLENLRITFRRVATVLDQCKARYWLEGGSLLGAARLGDLIPWDFDVDLGIYEADIEKCPLLLFATKHPVKDDEGFVWEKATEGDFLRVQFSETNRLHVDIFPFYPIDGIMTKNTWFADHPQDKEFPEYFIKNLTKIPFAGVMASAPYNVTQFLEFKFGPNVVQNPQYPNPEIVEYKP